MVRRLQAVIFDMDGLMVDSEHLHSRSLEIVLNRHGIKPELNKYGIIQTLGIGVASNWEKLKKKYHIDASVEKLTQEKHEAYQQLIPQIKPMPGLINLLKNLNASKIKMAVASGESIKNIHKILRQLKIDHYFAAIVSGEEVKNPKPNPDIFLEAAKQLKVEPGNCIVLEDAPSGVDAANEAGMISIGILTEFNTRSELKGANHIFSSLEELSAKKLQKMLQSKE